MTATTHFNRIKWCSLVLEIVVLKMIAVLLPPFAGVVVNGKIKFVGAKSHVEKGG